MVGLCLGLAALVAMGSTATASYGDPRKGSCAAGEMPAKFPFGGCMCMPKCNAGTCPAAPGGATAIPTCEFSSTGKPPPDYCGLRCKNGEKCPTGTSCEMPTGICAYPYPMGEPEADDLEARALDEQLVTAYSALEPQPEALVGGQAPWRYQYVPTKLQMPTGSNPPYSHGLEVDEDSNIYLTYFDSADSGRCLLRWSPKDSYTKFEVLGHGSEMCASGDHSNGPHGLRIAKEVRPCPASFCVILSSK